MKSFKEFQELHEVADEMKSLILKAYNDSGKDKKKFISLALRYTGLSRSGLDRTGYMDTLKFK